MGTLPIRKCRANFAFPARIIVTQGDRTSLGRTATTARKTCQGIAKFARHFLIGKRAQVVAKTNLRVRLGGFQEMPQR